jgi:hypothetical protein
MRRPPQPRVQDSRSAVSKQWTLHRHAEVGNSVTFGLKATAVVYQRQMRSRMSVDMTFHIVTLSISDRFVNLKNFCLFQFSLKRHILPLFLLQTVVRKCSYIAF